MKRLARLIDDCLFYGTTCDNRKGIIVIVPSHADRRRVNTACIYLDYYILYREKSSESESCLINCFSTYLTFDVKTSVGEQHCVHINKVYYEKPLSVKKNVFGISLISVDFFDYSRVVLLISLIFIEFFLIFKNLYIIFQHDLTLV